MTVVDPSHRDRRHSTTAWGRCPSGGTTLIPAVIAVGRAQAPNKEGLCGDMR